MLLKSLHLVVYFAAAKCKQHACFRGTGNIFMSPPGLTLQFFFNTLTLAQLHIYPRCTVPTARKPY